MASCVSVGVIVNVASGVDVEDCWGSIEELSLDAGVKVETVTKLFAVGDSWISAGIRSHPARTANRIPKRGIQVRRNNSAPIRVARLFLDNSASANRRPHDQPGANLAQFDHIGDLDRTGQ